MSGSDDVEARVSRLEARVEEVAADATAARHLAAARDRDIADLGVKVDANRVAINALGLQTTERFDRLEGRFDKLEGRFDRFEREVRTEFARMDDGFTEMRAKFDQLAGGQQRIVELLTTVIDDRGER